MKNLLLKLNSLIRKKHKEHQVTTASWKDERELVKKWCRK